LNKRSAASVAEDDAFLHLCWGHGCNQILSEGSVDKLLLLDETEGGGVV
jgi:hypothetical protein